MFRDQGPELRVKSNKLRIPQLEVRGMESKV